MTSPSGSFLILMALRSQYRILGVLRTWIRIFKWLGVGSHNLPARRYHDAAMDQTIIGDCLALLGLDGSSSIGSSCDTCVGFVCSKLTLAIESTANYHVEIPRQRRGGCHRRRTNQRDASISSVRKTTSLSFGDFLISSF